MCPYDNIDMILSDLLMTMTLLSLCIDDDDDDDDDVRDINRRVDSGWHHNGPGQRQRRTRLHVSEVLRESLL